MIFYFVNKRFAYLEKRLGEMQKQINDLEYQLNTDTTLVTGFDGPDPFMYETEKIKYVLEEVLSYLKLRVKRVRGTPGYIKLESNKPTKKTNP